jgi:hypothetical protein
MDQQYQATAAWLATAPQENAHFREISTRIYQLELDILAGTPAPDTRYGKWIGRLHDLQRFRHSTGGMPKRRRSAGDEYESDLAEWVHHQRQRRHTMCGYAAARLESIPGWRWNPRSSDWEDRLAELAVFTRDHPKVPTPTSSDSVERSLARWVQRQRDAARTGNLSGERAAKLRLLGFPMPKRST